MPTPTSPPVPQEPVERLLAESRLIWRGRDVTRPASRSTGFEVLDDRLPGGGWPLGALVEVGYACEGLGEFSLVLPLLCALTQQLIPVGLVAPPYIPYVPALIRAGIDLRAFVWIEAPSDNDAHWSAEQLLRDPNGAKVALLWSRSTSDRALRRLQLAAEGGNATAFLYRPVAALARSSPAAIRLMLFPDACGARVEFLKVRGARAGSVTLPFRKALP